MLDVTLWAQKDSVTAHLVNLTNPMTMKGSGAGVYSIAAAEGPHPSARRTQHSESDPAGEREKGGIPHGGESSCTLDLPSIELHEVIALDL